MNALAQHHRRSFAILIGLFIQAVAFGQLKAGFTSSTTAGCAPLLINFTDQSTGSPAQWKWDLGNGVISNLKDPSATYFNPGSYSIKLIVKNTGGIDSVIKEQWITVYPNPIVRFTADDSTGCLPFPVQFSNQSTTSKGTIDSWTWDFGDGTTSMLEQPKHIYSNAGAYNVTLKAINNFGCVGSAAKLSYIKTFDGVKASFQHSLNNPCQVPAAVSFNNMTTGHSGLTYLWNFGDGNTSEEANPVHIYTKKGFYTVKLVAVSPQGCRDTLIMENEIAIGSTQTIIDVPSVVCANKFFQLQDKTNANPTSVTWNFGDGSFSTELHPIKKYTGEGTYTIKVVNDYNGCLDSASITIDVRKLPRPGFSVVNAVSCKAPFTVSFNNESTDSKTYLWNFGDGSTSTEKQPQHLYKDTGRFDVTLIVFNENGCSDTLIKTGLISIRKPEIAIKGLPAGGCVPVSIQPVATIMANEPVTGYFWKFGDGSTSTSFIPVHSYVK
ncbi:MAG TPA: PKD domain-containing protein, partial [Flavisolibacter sp.]|nr:PKD domain-containing protein [Flavisolibacter sp.]